MFVGHGLLAFALVAAGARWIGRSREHALALGVAAGAFATLPDVDILYAPIGVVASGALDVEGFWAAGNVVHRAVTHSLVVAPIAAVAFGCWCLAEAGTGVGVERAGDPSTAGIAEHGVAVAVLAGLVVIAGIVSGPLGACVMAVFGIAGLGVATAAVRFGGCSPGAVSVVALFGLASHPFGDLVTGGPPRLLYPFDATLLHERLVLAADPTLHLFGAFWLELATIWLALAVYASLTDRRMRDVIHGRAALGVAYAAAVLAIPAPTLASSYEFVFSVLAVGVVGPVPLVWRRRWRAWRRAQRPFDDHDRLAAAATGLAAVTLASVGYAIAYGAL
ncbi:metal-dependent hydrolase [Halococcus agarilyticus]|uniref:metal-dependent hydrolase n=1 Tax=Halococcus agarilyticus TaxID=1232219 RepID=UPI000677A9CA|nr:metal-dependent hydrolase [Halococcus agarilyticus]